MYELLAPVRMKIQGTSPGSGDPAGDRFVFPMGLDTIMVVNVTTPAVFSHKIVGNQILDAQRLTAKGTSPASGDLDGDKFCFALGNRIIVINTSTPAVYAHKVENGIVEDAVQLKTLGISPGSGDPGGDRFVFPMGNGVIVINTSTPAVYAHHIDANTVGDAQRLSVVGTSPASGDPVNDRFAFARDPSTLVVINTATPAVYEHKIISGVQQPHKLKVEGTSPATGDLVGDRFVFAIHPWIYVVNTAAPGVFRHARQFGTIDDDD
jgi:hypothetical protein